ncbi:MAG: sugar phosphate nucleotidyltransferase, partial [Pseudomonadota bacterium]
MAGGSGTRFWPHSRNKRPKQFLQFIGDAPMVVETCDR